MQKHSLWCLSQCFSCSNHYLNRTWFKIIPQYVMFRYVICQTEHFSKSGKGFRKSLLFIFLVYKFEVAKLLVFQKIPNTQIHEKQRKPITMPSCRVWQQIFQYQHNYSSQIKIHVLTLWKYDCILHYSCDLIRHAWNPHQDVEHLMMNIGRNEASQEMSYVPTLFCINILISIKSKRISEISQISIQQCYSMNMIPAITSKYFIIWWVWLGIRLHFKLFLYFWNHSSSQNFYWVFIFHILNYPSFQT